MLEKRIWVTAFKSSAAERVNMELRLFVAVAPPFMSTLPVGGVLSTIPVTDRVNEVVHAFTPATAITTIFDGPSGVVPFVLIVSVVSHEGEQEAGEKEAEAPAGKPDTEKDIGVVVPEIKVEVIVFVMDPP